MPKTIIYYHRAYRKITGSGWKFLIELFAVSVPLFLFILFAYPLITERMSLIAQTVLSSYYPSGSIEALEKDFLIGNIFFVGLPGTNPSYLISIINLIISLAMIMFLPFMKRGKNICIYFVFLGAINLVSALFFTIYPDGFPYTASGFSEFYIKSEISMWLFIPLILGMAILPLPASIFPKLTLIIFAIIYSVIFGTLRYIVFLYIVSKFSFIYMALLFFAFGPLIDFVYIVGIYSFYNSRLAKSLKSSESIWKWSY